MVFAALICVAAGSALVQSSRAELARPRDLRAVPHAGSQSCGPCHPSHVASFRRTFHRTMTQEAGTHSVLGNFDGASLEYFGVRARMESARGKFLMTFEGPGRAPLQLEVERTVGSHRYQQYLARDRDVYYRLPIAWDVGAGRFIHMNQAFLTPDPQLDARGQLSVEDYNRHVTRWNDNCVFCHNVRANPGFDPETESFRTEVAELGVACEACHGPAGEHVASNEDPLRRYALHASGQADPTIRNPARMSAERSSEVCGRCHGQRITSDIARFHRQGDPFVPGEELSRYSKPLARDTRENQREGLFAARFWPDGTARLTAYEYQGYLQSPCRKSAEFSCESCHAMHAGDPSGQLRPDRLGDAACTSCHGELASPLAAAAHSRHDSSTSCRACHMPELVYGLVGVHLSHRIEVPDPARQAADLRPDACTLCHVDKTRSWAAQHGGAAAVSGDSAAQEGLSEVAFRLLAGDPIERSVSASALGRSTVRVSDDEARRHDALLLDTLVADPYPAVRAIASRALAQRLQARAPSAAERLRGFVATAPSEVRSGERDALQELLALPVLDRGWLAQLRSRAAEVAIEIGE